MIRVTPYRSWDELKELAPLWNHVLSRSAADTVFLTWEWCEAWWKNYGAGRRILALAAWDGNELTGVAPLLCDETQKLGKTWRTLRLIGDGSHDSDYLDLFCLRGCEANVMSAFTAFLESHRDEWDWLELNGPMENSLASARLVRCLQERHWRIQSEPIWCATLPLPRKWDEYLKKLAPRFRTTVRSTLALLHDSLKSSPRACQSERDLADWLPLLFDLHTRRWASDNLPGVFRDHRKRGFYHDFSRAALQQGWLAFHRLDWAERPLALQYGLIYKNRFHLLQEGYDPNFARVRPGVALRGWMMRHWIESGLEEYDFLAGVSPYKLAWGAQEKFSTRYVVAPEGIRSLVALDLPNWQVRAREKVAASVPAALLRLRKKALEARAQKKSYVDSVAAEPRSPTSRARRLISRAYASTPMGTAGSSIASNYLWPRAHGWSLPARRTSPVVHILHYHRVNDDNDPYLGGLDVRSFQAQMEYLARNFPVLSLDQIAAKDFSPRHRYFVAVTFDDGYRDNFVCAFPILKQLGIPATVFLATGHIGSDLLPWYDQVRLAFKLTTRRRYSVAFPAGPGGPLQDDLSRLRCMEQSLGWLRRLSEDQRKLALWAVFDSLGVPRDLALPNQMLHWDDIRQMAKHGLSFGAHTVTHPVLSRISGSQLKHEVEGSKRAIENRLQVPVAHFAYPFGKSDDYNSAAKQAVQAAGFRTAVTAIWGLNQPDDDPLELKRFTPWETEQAEFILRLDWFRFQEPRALAEREPGRSKPTAVGQEVRA